MKVRIELSPPACAFEDLKELPEVYDGMFNFTNTNGTSQGSQRSPKVSSENGGDERTIPAAGHRPYLQTFMTNKASIYIFPPHSFRTEFSEDNMRSFERYP